MMSGMIKFSFERNINMTNKKIDQFKVSETTSKAKKCPEGFIWCPITEKCVNKDDVKGKGRCT